MTRTDTPKAKDVRLAAAAVLMGQCSAHHQRLILRTLWTLVPRSRRRRKILGVARAYAPARMTKGDAR
jgi:hypothetical protein